MNEKAWWEKSVRHGEIEMRGFKVKRLSDLGCGDLLVFYENWKGERQTILYRQEEGDGAAIAVSWLGAYGGLGVYKAVGYPLLAVEARREDADKSRVRVWLSLEMFLESLGACADAARAALRQ